MKREIKFRAWSSFGKKMYNQDGELWEFLRYAYGAYLMQFTGLKDKNGKEVYEGDIFKIHDRYWTVVYVDVYASFMLESENDWREAGRVEFDEIAGNIYENPELLNQKP